MDAIFDTETQSYIYGIIVCLIFTALSWVRNLARFSFTFLVGVILAVFTTFYVGTYAIKMIREDGMGPDPMKFNPDGYITTLGITIYCYEGIGIIMPVMATCEKPEKFKEILIYVFITLVILYVSFAEVCYFAWGSNLTEPLVT